MASHSIEQNVVAVVQTAEEKLGRLLEESGTILYSSSATLTRGKYYFLGINPGGPAEGTSTIQNSLDNLKTQTENAYVHESWCRHGECKQCVGRHPLQQNYRALFDGVGEDLESVCASNLIFKRSKGEKDAGGWKTAQDCWPVHMQIIEIVQPRAIITFGKLPFDFIHQELEGAALELEQAGHGSWTWRRSTLQQGQKLIGLPHLSRYALRNNTQVLDHINSYLGVV
jgi:hypothetical protein